jgi:hypothetical protein
VTVQADSPIAKRVETGACFCGDTTAEMHGEPFWIVTDHDADCRRAIGGPLMLWVGYRREEVRFHHGMPAERQRAMRERS